MTSLRPLIAALALACTAGGAAAQNITIRFPVEYAAEVSQGLANQDFARRVEAASKGRIKVRYSPNGATFKGNELVQALTRGDAEMTTLVSAYWTSIAPQVQLFDLPYAFPDRESFIKVAANKPFVSKVYANVEAKGVKVLGLLPNTYIIPGTRSKQLLDPKDFAGMKIRGLGKINSGTLKSLNANAVSINVTEVPTALQQGVVDGTQTLMDAYVQYKLFDYIKYISDARYQFIYYPWTVNAKWWNSLKPEDQKIIQTAVDEAIAANAPVTAKAIAQAETELKAKGVTVVRLNAQQEAALQQATAVVWKQAEGDIGKDLIDEFKAISARK